MTIVGAEVVDLLADLVAIGSVNPDLSPSGAGEAEIARYVRDWAQMQGLRVELVDVPVGRPSVVIRADVEWVSLSDTVDCARILTESLLVN